MAKKMLIDTTHPEETRVVVVDGSRVEDFDYESITKVQISGNIYLAKVTRVEPSLQAAFVEYGGGRHGFLAFSEIHPDYYQIPVADREALLAAEKAAAEQEALEEEEGERRDRRRARRGKRADDANGEDRGENGRSAGDRNDEDGDGQGGRGRRRGRRRDNWRRRGLALESDLSNTPAPEKLVAAAAAGALNGVAPAFAESPSRAALAEIAAERGATLPDAEDAAPEATTLPDLSDVTEIEIRREATPEEAEALGSDVVVESIDLSGLSEGGEAAAEAAGAPLPSTIAAAAPVEESAVDETAAEDSAAEDAADEAAAGDESGRENAEETAEAADEETGEETGLEARDSDENGADAAEEDGDIEEIGAEDARDEIQPRRIRMRDYRIQEVIKRRQILLVQVVKEERGTKGAALTTYLSLAGRYCVLMPNTARGGGISRKITNAADRKRLKAVAQELEVPEGMGLIVRTAGANRTKAEIKRDFEYLLRQWSAIRDLTLSSIAPTLIYEEGSLIKRAIRDLYNKDIDSVQVEGEEGYREAKDYMKMLMPSHAKNVQPYRERAPLFMRYQVESQIAAMMNPTVPLKSGGYLVIGVTEALVAIDVNSGRSTKEGSIEETALKTNLEAAEEAARQMRLRDLAGLVVIDFIDMEDAKNNRAVEKRLKDKLKNDRARIQVGRISGFGLLEMSRQRLRPGLLEATTTTCPHCKGMGVIRSEESMALTILRAVEEEGVRGKTAAARVAAPVSVANYLMNHKRARIGQIEERYELQVLIEGDPAMVSPDFAVERVKPIAREEAPSRAIQVEAGFADLEDEEPIDEAEILEAEESAAESESEGEGEGESEPRENGRRRRRRRGRDRQEDAAEVVEAAPAEAPEDGASDEEDDEADDEREGVRADAESDDDDQPRRRRGRRGGRRRRKKADETDPLPTYDLSDEDEAEEGAAESPLDAASLRETTDDEADRAPANGAALEAAAQALDDEASDPVVQADAPVGETPLEDAPLEETPLEAAPVDETAPVEVIAADPAEPARQVVSGDAPPPADHGESRGEDGAADQAAPSLVAAAARNAGPKEPSAPRKTGWWSFRRG